jgi:hypothetical protein
MAPRPQQAPAMPAVRVLEALPAQEEPPRPAPRPAPRPTPMNEDVLEVESRRPRERLVRPFPEDGPLREVPPPKRRSRAGVWVVLVLVFGGMALGFYGVVWFFGHVLPLRPAGSGGAGFQGTTWQPGGVRPGLAGTAEAEPIKPEEFEKVLEQLEKKPAVDELATLAARLAVTTPTEDQKEKHKKVKDARALGEAGPNQAAMARLQDNDDILNVSRALNPLLQDKSPTNKKLAAQALQKWGTEENVQDLANNIAVAESGVFDLRIEIAKALAFIGDERGIAAVATRLADIHDSSRGIISVLVSCGPKAEPEVRKYLTDSKANVLTKRHACQVLKEIGTQESIKDLESLADSNNPFYAAEARAAIDAIRKRRKG